ncbi:hypothetical protein [Zooshikella harenae]|uniref:Uncharacterized protein n=1 Tax=Zooshikella harenae TaxID=2827238 RepID=A0ABS5ZGF8_9GAMM|nr:hypothetical protein [Zooshikella harenae]MBU2712863.1 hypothetical protein [Zooshikella harenae]
MAKLLSYLQEVKKMISLKVNENDIDSNAMTFSQLSFGKGDGFQTFSYEMKIAKEELLDKLTPMYDEGVEELKEDDQITGEFEPPYPGAADYPSLLEFIDVEGSYLYEYLYAYHKFDILGIAFNEDNDVASYVINSLDSIQHIGEEIVIKGTAIKR